jgi:tripeptide aminopeptidase
MKIARNEWFERDLVDRFCRYVKIYTTSDRLAEAKPSTPWQWDLLNLLRTEMEALGLTNVHTHPLGYVLGTLPATPGREKAPSVALLAHVDTAPDAPGQNVKPLVHENYDGSALRLPAGLVIDPEENPHLKKYVGTTVITSDGTTLLGADDKAGIAEILSAVSYLVAHPELPHGPLEIIFTSDEEVGRGTEGFPFDQVKSKIAYTLDGNEEGGIESECYNAITANVTLWGRSYHPGDARGKLVNAVTMAGLFLTMLPRSESPEATDGRFGCLWAHDVTGGVEKATIEIEIRDFERAACDRRVASLGAYAAAVEGAFPGGKVEIATRVRYLNMKEKLDQHPLILSNLHEAVRRSGIEPFTQAIRGGTDGARLTELGLPTPNVFTGGMNYHSRTEWVAVAAMVRASLAVVELAGLWADHTGPEA